MGVFMQSLPVGALSFGEVGHCGSMSLLNPARGERDRSFRENTAALGSGASVISLLHSLPWDGVELRPTEEGYCSPRTARSRSFVSGWERAALPKPGSAPRATACSCASA